MVDGFIKANLWFFSLYTIAWEFWEWEGGDGVGFVSNFFSLLDGGGVGDIVCVAYKERQED